MRNELDDIDQRIVTILNNFGFAPIESLIIVTIRRLGTASTKDLTEALETNRDRIYKYTNRLRNKGVIIVTPTRAGYVYRLSLEFFDELYAIAEKRYQDDLRRIEVLRRIM